MGGWHQASTWCPKRCLQDTWRPPAVTSLTWTCGALFGRTFRSLAARGNMDEVLSLPTNPEALGPQQVESLPRLQEETTTSIETTEKGIGETPTHPTQSEQDIVQSSEEDRLLGEDSDTKELEDKVKALKLKTRLSGAGKKRLRWLMAHGSSFEEAMEKAQKPWKPMGQGKPDAKGQKRAKSDGSTPEDHKRKKKKESGEPEKEKDKDEPETQTEGPKQTPSKSFKQALEGERLGILHENFPAEQLSEGQMEDIQNAILQAVEDNSSDTVYPVFNGISRRSGCLILNCQDKETYDWLMAQQQSLKPWEGANLKFVAEGEIPKTKIATVFLPNSKEDTNERILNFFQKQNRGCGKAKEWKVLGRSEEGTSSLLTLAIDFATADMLEKEGPWVNFKFGKVQLRLKRNTKRPREESPERKKTEKKPTTVARPEATQSASTSKKQVDKRRGYTRPSETKASKKTGAQMYPLFLKKGPQTKGPSVSFRKKGGGLAPKSTEREKREDKSPGEGDKETA